MLAAAGARVRVNWDRAVEAVEAVEAVSEARAV